MKSPHTIPVPVSLTDSQLVICRQPFDLHRKPRRWRALEYAMTKATARRSLDAIAAGKPTELFELNCLVGEVARLVKQTGEKSHYAAFEALGAAIGANPDASKAVARAEKVDAALAKAKQLRRRAAQLERAAQRVECRALATARGHFRNQASNEPRKEGR